MAWDGRFDDLPDEWEKFINETPDGPGDPGYRRNGNGIYQRHNGLWQANAPPSLGWWRDKLRRYDEYCDLALPPVKYLVPRLFPEGVTLIVGRPKIGKSWLCQQVGCAIAKGDVTLVGDDGSPPRYGDVLCLSLEDNDRRIKTRGLKYFGALRECWPLRMQVATQWRRLDEGGLEAIGEWCADRELAPDPTLVIIDTLQRVRAPKQAGQSEYDADMRATEGLIRLAGQHAGLSILINHHDRKQDAGDVFDTVSGTLGLQGGVDTIALLKRSGQGGMTLYIKGRDLEEDVEKAMLFDKEACRWKILGEAPKVRENSRREAVLNVIANQEISTPRQVAEELDDMTIANARKILQRLVKDGTLARDKEGHYTKCPTCPTPGVPPQNSSDIN